MSWNAIKLKSSYRDQLIREIQHLKSHKQDVALPVEVVEVMEAVKRHKARLDGANRHRFWDPRSIRRDDVLEASELYLLEATLIEHLELDDLKLRVAGFRDMLSHLLTAGSYSALSEQFADLSKDVDEHRLRAEARALASRIYRRYEGVPAVERLRRAIVTKIIIAPLLLTMLLLLIFFVTQHIIPIVAWVGAAGALGASVSTMSRLYDLDARHEPFKTWLALESGQMTLVLAPLVGAIFALVMLAIFRGRVVTGILFPEFDACWDFLTMRPSEKCNPALALDMAKLMLWGFAAGWGERLVPDVLNKLTPQASAGINS